MYVQMCVRERVKVCVCVCVCCEREKEGLGTASVRCPLSGDYMLFFLFYQVLTDCLLIQCHIIINATPHVCVTSCLLIFNCHASN